MIAPCGTADCGERLSRAQTDFEKRSSSSSRMLADPQSVAADYLLFLIRRLHNLTFNLRWSSLPPGRLNPKALSVRGGDEG